MKKLWIGFVIFSCVASLRGAFAEEPAAGSSVDPQLAQQVVTTLQQNPQLLAMIEQSLQQKKGTNLSTGSQQVQQLPAKKETHASSSAKKSAQSDQRIGSVSQIVTQELDPQLNQAAFKSVLQQAFPLSPDQIKTFHNTLDDTQRASAAEPYDLPPKPTSSSILVNLSPGSTPPVIRLSRGFVSSLVFLDGSGAPWPIAAYDLGNPGAYNIAWNRQDNTLLVQAQTGYTYGNLAIMLQGLDTPVMLTLVPGQRVVDYRVDLRILGHVGPNAKPEIMGLPDQGSPVLLSVLDGVPPKGAKRLTVSNDSGEAWVLGDKLFFRSRYKVLSPGWVEKMSSADGMSAYLMQQTPVVLVARHGKTVSLKLSGY